MENFINSIKKSTECINENKYFIGIAMILLNIGARFIIDELDDDLRKMISNKFIRRLFIFCSFFKFWANILYFVIEKSTFESNPLGVRSARFQLSKVTSKVDFQLGKLL